MAVDPMEVVRAARDNGEPDLAEWLQREVDQAKAVAWRFEAKCWGIALGLAASAVLIALVLRP